MLLIIGDSIVSKLRVRGAWVDAQNGTTTGTYVLPEDHSQYSALLVALGGNDLAQGKTPEQVIEGLLTLIKPVSSLAYYEILKGNLI